MASNVPGRPGAAGTVAEPTPNKSMRKEALSYDTNSSLKTTRLPMGRLQRLSVAVAVDGRTETTEEGAESWVARGADERTQFEDLISKAVGINLDRGDQLAVVNTQFSAITDTLGDVAPTAKPFWMTMIPWAILLVISALLFSNEGELVAETTEPVALQIPLDQLQERAEEIVGRTISLQAPPGTYTLELVLEDSSHGYRTVYRDTLGVPSS